ncbi:hypothetical protein N1031_15515 [Herbiconiux moechotypicola]|uniref:Polynucleotide kinase PNKP phosphatase domain-containing protein n=1 Tax=Herbiconiux moechotypicola TaxID=637393 RepID=A0ABP5QVC4_9MICO|nr:hypothetical protein [Herbiconiux moechotypicola]MCS5731173.1 hypothetical protein [Herbiconiux moechotypicola]
MIADATSAAVRAAAADALPGHWHPADGTLLPGPAVIFDLDGVIADALHRQHFLHREEPDWAGFYGGVEADGVIEAGRVLASTVRDEVRVVILTGRIDDVAATTRAWLDGHALRWDLLVCRPPDEDDSSRHAVDYKRDEVARLRDWGVDPVLAIDDNRKITDMYVELGIPSLYLPSGYYDNTSRYDGGV